MRIAIKYDNVFIDPNGNIGGHETGDTLVRRLLRLFPNSIVIGQGRGRATGSTCFRWNSSRGTT